MITRSENDTRQLRLFSRFLIERGAHKALEATLGKRLPFETTTVPNDFWDPRGEFISTYPVEESSDG